MLMPHSTLVEGLAGKTQKVAQSGTVSNGLVPFHDIFMRCKVSGGNGLRDN
jgi:hypothetical protein